MAKKKPAASKTVPQILVGAFFGTWWQALATISVITLIVNPSFVFGLLNSLVPFAVAIGAIMLGYKFILKGFR